MAKVMQAIPAFCRGTKEALLEAISEGGRFYPLHRIIWCYIKSGERAGQLAFVTPGMNEGDEPIVEYMQAAPCFDVFEELPDIEDASEDMLYIVDKSAYVFDGEKYTRVLGGEGGGGGSAELLEDLTTSVSVGGITSGKTYYEGTSLEKILRDMLNPIGYPTFTNPSVTISATEEDIIETGSTLETVITASFDRGTISPAYGTDGYRSGVATSYKLNDGAEQSSNTFNVVVSAENPSFSVTVAYEEGEQPRDSQGNDYQTPLLAGTVTSNTLNYEFVEALYANTANIATVAKLPLISKENHFNILSFPDSPEANPEIFDIPASWDITGIEVRNVLTGAFEDCSSEFTATHVTHDDALGNPIDYIRYTNNLGYDIGNRDIKILWN